MTRDEFFRDYIHTWEDGGSDDPARTHSLDPVDGGNWTGGIAGVGTLVGSQHGVTPAVLAKARNVPAASITREVMRALSLDEAARIASSLFYHAPHFDLLPWDAVVASVVDFGWGTGPVQSAKLLQRLIGAADDGQIGLFTVRAYGEWIGHIGIAEGARQWQRTRDDFYRLICAKRPANARYLTGWMRRSAYFAPGTPWWKRFTAPERVAA